MFLHYSVHYQNGFVHSSRLRVRARHVSVIAIGAIWGRGRSCVICLKLKAKDNVKPRKLRLIHRQEKSFIWSIFWLLYSWFTDQWRQKWTVQQSENGQIYLIYLAEPCSSHHSSDLSPFFRTTAPRHRGARHAVGVVRRRLLLRVRVLGADLVVVPLERRRTLPMDFGSF